MIKIDIKLFDNIYKYNTYIDLLFYNSAIYFIILLLFLIPYRFNCIESIGKCYIIIITMY